MPVTAARATTPPIVRIALANRIEAQLAKDCLQNAFRTKVEVTVGGDGPARVIVMPLDAVADFKHHGERVVAVGDQPLPELVPLMAPRPWLDHVVSPKVLDTNLWGTTLPGAVWRLLFGQRVSLASFFGRGFRGRQVRMRDSNKRERRIGVIADYATENGATGSIVDKIHDVAEELITNAMYDGPAEKHGKVAQRTQSIFLTKDEAVDVTYGTSRQVFFLRVRDQCGSLRRSRMFDVLQRCASQSAVSVDTSVGGAGLGMWRIMSAASLAVVHVKPRESTEFVIGIDMTKGRRSNRGRALHLFFDDLAAPHGAAEVAK